MLAFSDIINKNWTTTWNLKPLTFNFFDKIKGRLLSQNTNSSGKTFEIPHLLYVDDGVFVFEDRLEIEKGTQRIYDTFNMIGFQMHVGNDNNKSKSEAMFISRSMKEDDANQMPEKITINQGTINFCNDFKYLGSIINNDLKDDKEILIRIKKANAQFGALKHVLLGRTLRLKTKINLFNAILMNTVLWGCESWTLSTSSKQKLSTFQHRSIRRILKISIYEVVENRIKNSEVRSKFNNAQHIITTIKTRQLIWLGKIAKMNMNRIPRKLLACWTKSKRKPGRPQLNIRNTYAESLETVFPAISKNIDLQDWLPALAKPDWEQKVKKWIKLNVA
jgi:hypothetical protein